MTSEVKGFHYCQSETSSFKCYSDNGKLILDLPNYDYCEVKVCPFCGWKPEDSDEN